VAKRRPKREHLEQLLALAKNYRGWSGRELAKALERDPHNLVPDGGVPRLDLVLRLSEVLDWPVETVVDDLCQGARVMRDVEPDDEATCAEQAAALSRESWLAIRSGRYAEGLELAAKARTKARTAEQIEYTYLLEYWGNENQGRYSEAMVAAREGLKSVRLDAPNGRWMRGYLANSHFHLGNIHESLGICTQLLEEIGAAPDASTDRPLQAMLLALRGQCRRVLATQAHPVDRTLAELALADLTRSELIFKDQAGRRQVATDLVGAALCHAAIVEVRTILELMDPESAVEELLGVLDAPVPDPSIGAEWQIAVGWTCVHGCNVILRHLLGAADSERRMAVFTNKADECATATGNWALRERVWTIEHLRRREIEVSDSAEDRWVLDKEDIATLTGAMGRFPALRLVGWQILSKCPAVGEEEDA